MDIESADTGPFRILFVCTGNTCRSPMAEVIARRQLDELGWTRVEVRSAGVAAQAGRAASDGAIRVAESKGLDLSDHVSTPLTSELTDGADLILTMSSSHLLRVLELGAGDRAAVITSFAEGAENAIDLAGVPDPIGGPDEEYAATFEVLDGLVKRSLQRIAPLVQP